MRDLFNTDDDNDDEKRKKEAITDEKENTKDQLKEIEISL